MNEKVLYTIKKRGRPCNEKRREEIVAIAGRLFISNGLQATTMEHIARELGISKLTLYSRFKSKDDLFAAVIENKSKQYIPNSFFGNVDKLPIEESLYKIVYGLMKLITSSDARNMERMLIAESNNNPSLMMIFYRSGPARVKAMITDYLERLHKEKKLNISDAIYSANLLGSLIKGSDIYSRINMGITPKPTKAEIEDYCKKVVASFIKMHS
jgi:TetR/AcrR family transcriptional repressor of mexJK operon